MTGYMKTFVMAALLGGVVTTWAFPLRVDIDVSAKRERRQVGSGADGEVKSETVVVKVKVRKSGGDLPEGKLFAELYVIGKQVHTGNYGIIDVQKGEFELLKEKDYTAEYVSPTYTLAETKGNINVGGKYETYLVVISDAEGNVIDWRCGRSIRDEGMELIRTLGPKTMFDKDGNVLGELQNPGQALKAAIPSATAPLGIEE